MGSKLLTND